MSRLLLVLLACALSVTVAVIDDPLFISPAAVDVLLTDVTAADLSAQVSKLFGHMYLSQADSPRWPIRGRLFERHRRIFISAPVAPRRAPHVAVNVFFIVDTGSPYTFLSDQALRSLSVALPTDSDSARVTINGVSTIVHRSHAHFEDVNVLGSNFLDQLEARLTVDYGAETATIERGDLVDESAARTSETAREDSHARTEL